MAARCGGYRRRPLQEEHLVRLSSGIVRPFGRGPPFRAICVLSAPRERWNRNQRDHKDNSGGSECGGYGGERQRSPSRGTIRPPCLSPFRDWGPEPVFPSGSRLRPLAFSAPMARAMEHPARRLSLRTLQQRQRVHRPLHSGLGAEGHAGTAGAEDDLAGQGDLDGKGRFQIEALHRAGRYCYRYVHQVALRGLCFGGGGERVCSVCTTRV